MKTDRSILVIDSLAPDNDFEIPNTRRVLFPVRPPLVRSSPDQGDQVFRLADTEGWIEVMVADDGSIEVRSKHGSLDLVPMSSNSVRIRMRDQA